MRQSGGGYRPTHCRPGNLRSPLWRIRGDANSGDRGDRRASPRRVAVDIRVNSGGSRRDVPAGAAHFWGVGSVIGDNMGFLIGRKLGRKTVLRYGAKVGLTNERFGKIENKYVRYGSATVLFARFFSILRQLNGIVAGMLGMFWWRFVLLDAVGAAVWVSAWVFAPA